jgi:ADP-ribosyl-[dinitrogen reductase] hydrolase
MRRDDTNGAIAGALLGAYHGEDAIPKEWVEKVLHACEAAGNVWWTDYHPRFLLEMVP